MSDAQVVDSNYERKYSAFYHIYKFTDENDSSLLHSNDSEDYTPSFFNLSKENEILFKFIVQGVGISIVALFGLVGNFFSILVLSKKRMRSPISCFLTGLAIADAIFSMIAAIVIGIPSILIYFGESMDLESGSSSKLILLTPVFFGLALTSQTASIFFTLAVTAERYIAIVYPFKARTMLTWNRACLIAVGVMFFAILYNIPRWWEYDIENIYDSVTKELVGYRPIPSSLRQNKIYDVYYVYVSYLILIELIPIVVLCILNTLIYKKVREANRERQSLSSSQRQENSLAMMLLAVVIVFVFCNSLPLLESIIKVSFGLSQPIVEFECIRNFFLVFNSSVNFVIYCFLGEKFREVFIQMWPPCLRCFCECCCCCPEKAAEKRRYWNASVSDGSSSGKRLSLFSASTKTLKEVIHLDGVFVSHI